MSSLIPNPFNHDPSATALFKALPNVEVGESSSRPLRAVVIGGGTGASMAIRTLLSMGLETSAVVAMADDGGSTGILRNEAGATTPGDVRKCLSAMAANPDDPLVKAFKVRFGFAENHSLGNLILSALEVTSGSFPEAITICEELLQARGHVYPSTLSPVSLVAKTTDGRTLEGQAVASHSRTALSKVALKASGNITAYEPAVQAILSADLVLLGPGSLFTSIIPNLLVSGIAEAIQNTSAEVIFVCAVADMQGETRSMTVLDHWQALASHGLKDRLDWMLIQGSVPKNCGEAVSLVHYLLASPHEVSQLKNEGIGVIEEDFVGTDNPTWHDPHKLRESLAEVITSCRLIPT